MSSSTLSGSQNKDFSDFLANTLRVGTNLRVYHVSTQPTPTSPIYAPAPGEPEQLTTCESHFLTVSQHHGPCLADDSANTAGTGGDKNTEAENPILVFGIEVLVFTTNTLTTIFVSKADSSGFLRKPLPSSQASTSIIRAVTAAFLEWLICRNLSTRILEPSIVTRHEVTPLDTVHHDTGCINKATARSTTPRKRRLVLSLFARSQNQYLFPGSVENTAKHVLDDRQLIKWWCRVLDGLVELSWPGFECSGSLVTPKPSAAGASVSANGSSTPSQHTISASRPASGTAKIRPQAYVIVPGCDRSETIRSFFPLSARYPSPGTTSTWHNSYPKEYLAETDAWQSESNPTCPVPLRCMVPRLPDDPKARYCEDLDHAGIDAQGQWRDIRSLQQFWETMEFRQECAAGRLVGFIWVTFGDEDSVPRAGNGMVSGSHSPTLDVLEPHDHANMDNLVLPKLLHSDAAEQALAELAPASIVLSAEQYNSLADFLINHTDFAGIELATKSTNDWIAKVKELSGAEKFGADVEGRLRSPQTLREDSGVAIMDETIVPGLKHARDVPELPKVNVLTGMRKKRKVEDSRPADDSVLVNASIATAASSKQNGPLDTNHDTGEAVRTLSAGLVRKKPKASPT